MTHAVSATYTRFDHMSPTAAALAVLLHVLTALALWWVSPLNQQDWEVEPIEVTFEKPPAPEAKPPEPATPPPAPAPTPSPAPQAAVQTPPPAPPPPLVTPPQALPQSSLRVLPPPSTTTDKPTEPPKPPPGAKPEEKSEPPKAAAKAEEPTPQEVKPEEKATAPPAPPKPRESEQILPSLQAPQAPATAPREVPKPAPPPPPPPVQHQQARVAPPPPAAPQIAPSPLTNPGARNAPSSQSATAAPEFINPASKYEQARAIDQYIWQILAQISRHTVYIPGQNENSIAGVRFIIARSGQLVGISIDRSSGDTVFDRAVLQAFREAAPYPPLPSEIPGAQYVFTLTMGGRMQR